MMQRKSEKARDGDKPLSTPDGGRPVRANQIDENLRRVYDDMLSDDVPDRFEELLRQLREQDDRK